MNKDLEKGLPVNEIVPIKLVSGQDRISGYIDGLNALLKMYGVKPSTFLDGATFLCNPYINHNPDWIAQSAHSFREIGYLLSGAPTKKRGWKGGLLVRLFPVLSKLKRFKAVKRSKKAEEIISMYIEEAEAVLLANRITEITHIFAEISHHYSQRGNEKDVLKRLVRLGIAKETDKVLTEAIFMDLAKKFLNTITETISANITIHKKIDIFCEGLKENKADRKHLAFLLASTPDARKYFYAVAPITSIDWLWKNGFFEVVKEKSDGLRYRTPELDYLARVAEKDPKKVVDFILSFDTTANLNLETIDRFLWISTKLPAKELKRVIPVMKDKKWVKILADKNHWGFGYKQMFDTLSASTEYKYKSILTLAESALLVRSKEDAKKNAFGSVNDPFYLSDIHYTDIFQRLDEIKGTNEEGVLKLATNTLADIVILSGEKEDEVFPIGDIFSLFDVNFFNLSLDNQRHLSSRDDVRDLSAIAKIFIGRLVSQNSDKPDEIRRLHDTYILSLPDSRTMWRFRLYVWSLAPEVFKDELKKAFFRGLESEKTLWPITSGAEYEEALIRGFRVLSQTERGDYIQKAFTLFESIDREHPYGFDIFSSIYTFLSEEDKKRAEVLYKHPLKENFKPEPNIHSTHAGTVVPQTPPNSEDEWKKPVPEIVEILKTKWEPNNLQKMDTKRDFLRPISAEGVANLLLTKIKERLVEYVGNAELFFDRDKLDAHYTYNFLRGVHDAVRADRKSAVNIDWAPIVRLGMAIMGSGKIKPFEAKRDRKKNGCMAL